MKVMSGCKFKKGFMIEITSWENDGDHYLTKIIDGLTKEEVNQFSYIMPFFKSRNSKSKGFGNKEFCMFSVEEVLMEGLDEGKLTREFLGKFFFYDGHPDLDKIQNLLGCPVEYDYDFIRVFESMNIYHLPEDVVIPEFNPELISEV